MKESAGGTSSPVYAAGGLALGAAAIAYWQHYNDNVAAPPRLWLADGPLRERVLPHCSALLRPFAPTPWAANRHAQTVLGFMRGLTMRNRYSRQLIMAVDGATLGLDWFDGCDSAAHPAPANAPVLIVCHGINGGSHEGYVKWACAAAVARGWRAVVLNYRGCNGLPFTAPRGYAATMSHDVFTAVYSVRARYPDAPLLAVGYSLGGLKLTKYVAEADAGLHVPPPGQPRLFSGSGLAAAAVVSSPVDLKDSSAKLADRSSLSFLYNLAVAYKLREHIARHRTEIAALSSFDVNSVLSAWTLAEIEDRGLPASLGFRDRHHYYEEASSQAYIPAINTPTLLLLAEDDPFLGVVPDVECSRNPCTLLALTRRGGHVAFLQGSWPLGRAYMDDAVIEFFAATLEHLHGPAGAVRRASDGGAAGEGGGLRGGGATQASADSSAAGPSPAADAGEGAKGLEEMQQVTDAVRAGALAAALAASRRSSGGGHHAGCGHSHSQGQCTPHHHGPPHHHGHHHGRHGDYTKPHTGRESAAAATAAAAPAAQEAHSRSGGIGAGGTPEVPRQELDAIRARKAAAGSSASSQASRPPQPAQAASASAAADRLSEQLQLLLALQQRLDQQQRARAAASAAAGPGGKGAGGAPGRAAVVAAAGGGAGSVQPEAPRSRL